MEQLIIVLIIVEIIIIAILKIMNVRFHKKHEQLEDMKKEQCLQSNLMSEKVSYERYEKISKAASVANSPVRISGDFMDFIISHIVSDCKLTENNIINID